MKGPKQRPTPKIQQDKPKLGGGNVVGSNEDRAKPRQCDEHPKKKTNP